MKLDEIKIVEKSLNIELNNEYSIKEKESHIDEFNFGKEWKVINVKIVINESYIGAIDSQIKHSKYFGSNRFFGTDSIQIVDLEKINLFDEYMQNQGENAKSSNFQNEFQNYNSTFQMGRWIQISSDAYDFVVFNISEFEGLRIFARFNRRTGELTYQWLPPL